MTITWHMPVLVGRCATVGGAVRARSGHHRPAQLLLGGPEEEAGMPNPVYLEPQAKAVVDAIANPPYS
jgi:hypothetical protein